MLFTFCYFCGTITELQASFIRNQFTCHPRRQDMQEVSPSNQNTDPQIALSKKEAREADERMYARKNRRTAIIAGAVLATIAAGTVAWGVSAQRAPESNVPAATASPFPNETGNSTNESPEPRPSATEAAPVTPEISAEVLDRLEQYDSASFSVESFNALPKDEQRLWWLWKSQSGIAAYSALWSKVNGDMPLPSASLNNTPDQILAIGTYQFRFLYSLEGATREKGLVSLLNNGLQSPGYNALLDSINSTAPSAVTRPGVLADQDAFPLSASTGSSDLVEADGISPFRDITNPTGTVRWSYIENANPVEGKPAVGSWYRD